MPVAKAPPKPAPKPAPKADAIYAPARPAKPKRRHFALFFSLIVFVLVPFAITAGYLWTRAVDQYASSVGFTVRREEAPAATDFLGGLPGMTSSMSSDSDILFEFIQSQELVEQVDAELDLHSLYARHHDVDPFFSLAPDTPIEDLVDYWRRMVMISYAPGTGLIELKILAFTPEDARTIATAIFDSSSRMINQLSSIAREDTTRYAREELETAVGQLSEARQALTAFRSRTRSSTPLPIFRSRWAFSTRCNSNWARN